MEHQGAQGKTKRNISDRKWQKIASYLRSRYQKCDDLISAALSYLSNRKCIIIILLLIQIYSPAYWFQSS